MIPADPMAWWLAAGVAVIAELLTGTFYLLMVALGLTAGALAAHLGLAPVQQVVAAAVAGCAAVGLCWQVRRRGRALAPASQANPDLNLDIGQTVHVDRWEPDGTARVHYRGSTWTARLATPQPAPAAGPYVIRAIDGAVLVLAP